MVESLVSFGRNPLWVAIAGAFTVLTVIGLAYPAANPASLAFSVILIASFFILLLAYGSHLLARRMFVISGQLRLQQAIIDHTLEAMFVTDAAQTILAVNPAFERITGYSAREAIGNTPRMLSSGQLQRQSSDRLSNKQHGSLRLQPPQLGRHTRVGRRRPIRASLWVAVCRR